MKGAAGPKLDQLVQVRKMIEGCRWKAQENCDGVDMNWIGLDWIE